VNVWTAADAAELDVLLWELTGSWEKHRPTCDERPCPHLQEAIGYVLEWREARQLRTRAESFRIADVLELLNTRPTPPMSTGHECFFRGCTTVVPDERYHCDRHQAILERQRAATADRNSKRAALRNRRPAS
jgi:hypothetical protein